MAPAQMPCPAPDIPATPPGTRIFPDLAAQRPAELDRQVIVGTAVAGLLVGRGVVAQRRWLQGFAEPGGPMTEIGRLSGLVASYLLLIQVLLMARVPWLEGIWGQDVLARQHRLVGFTSFHLMLVHIVTITLGYAAAGRCRCAA